VRPRVEPVDGAAVYQGWELSSANAKRGSNRREAENDLKQDIFPMLIKAKSATIKTLSSTIPTSMMKLRF